MNIDEWLVAKAEEIQAGLEQEVTALQLLEPGQKVLFNLRLVQEPVVVPDVAISSGSEGTFKRGNATYYKRCLTMAELDEIGKLDWRGWKKKIAQHFLKTSNQLTTKETLNSIVREAKTLNGMGYNVLVMINAVLYQARAHYRLTYPLDGSSNDGPYRFYKYKPQEQS